MTKVDYSIDLTGSMLGTARHTMTEALSYLFIILIGVWGGFAIGKTRRAISEPHAALMSAQGRIVAKIPVRVQQEWGTIRWSALMGEMTKAFGLATGHPILIAQEGDEFHLIALGPTWEDIDVETKRLIDAN